MSNKQEVFNFRSLLALLDEQIYTSFSDQEKNEFSITSFITWDTIRKIFPSKAVFLSTLSIYHQTIINEKEQNGNFKMRPLVMSCEVSNSGITIEHSTSALIIYLFHNDSSSIENSYIEEVFLNALSKFNMRSDVLYSIISESRQYETSPEELKTLLGINYTNAMLKSRVLLPIEKSISKLYEIGRIPFYIKISIKRAVIGRGSKVNNIIIDVINYLDLLRIKRMRPEHMSFIMRNLIKFFPFDYPFLEEDIKKLDDNIVADIYQMIRYIEKDPDYPKIDTSILVRYKLQQQFNVKIQD